MDFTIIFFKLFFVSLFLVAPLLLFFMIIITIMGLIIGRAEKWSHSEAIYYAFITATTVGYGDFRPIKKSCRFLAIIIAFLGLIFSGIIVGIAVNVSTVSFKETHNLELIQEYYENIISTENNN